MNRKDMTRPEHTLLPEQLQEKHVDEHPHWELAQWRQAVAQEETQQGYWMWVAMKLWEENNDGRQI